MHKEACLTLEEQVKLKKSLLAFIERTAEKGGESMSQYQIEINANTAGSVEWRLTAVHQAKDNNDADCKDLTSVVNKLTGFTKQLEAISQEEQ